MDHVKIETAKYHLHIPNGLLSEGKDQRVLFVDSSFFTGSTSKAIITKLKDEGFEEIDLVCLAKSAAPNAQIDAPQHAHFESGVLAFDYPWGPA